MNNFSIVTLDIGGTKVNFGRFRNGEIETSQIMPFCADQDVDTILKFLVTGIMSLWQHDVKAITIGVPTVLDIETGTVFDANNVPAWQNYNLKLALSQYFNCDIYINNDVNCFVAGEVAYGKKAQNYKHLVGMCLGTGLGIGFVLNQQLYAGANCGAGELGSIPYKNGILDDYCSGSFFQNVHSIDGAEAAKRAKQGDSKALAIFDEFAQHLAHAIKYLLFVTDPEIIIFGGSASKSFDLFIKPLEKALDDFPFMRTRENLILSQSKLDDAAMLGAVSLYLQSKCYN